MKENAIYWMPIDRKEVETQFPWDTVDFRSMYEDMHVAQRRTQKDVGVLSERSRLAITCSAMEDAFLDMADVGEKIKSDYICYVDVSKYIALIDLALSTYPHDCAECFLGSTFLHADIAKAQYGLLKRIEAGKASEIERAGLKDVLLERIRYLEAVIKNDQHSFDLPIMPRVNEQMAHDLLGIFFDEEQFHFDPFEQDRASQILSADVSIIDSSSDERITDNRGKDFLQIAKEGILEYLSAVRKKKKILIKVSLSDYSHRIITELLHDLIYSDEHRGMELPVVYSDGSQAKSFPLGCLNNRGNSGFVGREMHVGFISERHTSLDKLVSMYWFLNMEVSGRGQTGAEVDMFCYKRSQEMFRSIQEQNKDMRIYLYQTGFPFAIIGFYRALVELLMEQRCGNALQSKLQVIPMYFCGEDNPYKQGLIWE